MRPLFCARVLNPTGTVNVTIATSRPFWLLLTACIAVVFCGHLHAAESAQQIIAKSVAANERDWAANPLYSYNEQTKDADGSKTEQVIMLYGSPYHRLLKVHGEPLSRQDQQREQMKFDRAAAERRAESRGARASRIAKFEKSRARDHLMMSQLTRALTFQLIGQSSISGRQVFVLTATPRPDYQPPNMESRVLTGMKGQLWIDTLTYQWVKVEAEVVSPVTIGGFLATVQPGTQFELEKQPVTNDIWLPSHFSVHSQSRILGLFRHSTQEDDRYFDYMKTAWLP